MSKRKMCPYYDHKVLTERCDMAGCKPKSGIVYKAKCPRNTNARCEIVPRKAKPKMVRVKAKIWNGYYASAHKEQEWKMNAPCTILIEAKYLKGRKG